MIITYKCKKCKSGFKLNPDLDNVNEDLRLIIINSLMSMTESDFCYNCCEKEDKYE